MKKLFLLLWLMATPLLFVAQHVLSGTVKSTDGEPLTGANIRLEKTGYVVPTDEHGKFIITGLKTGHYLLKVTFLGFQDYEEKMWLEADESVSIFLEEQLTMMDEVIVSATRASEKTPTTFEEIDRQEIEKENLGKDLPFILQHSPSVVTTSDAGAGVGYTGLRIRGSDQTRINVTVNGIPLNDPESQGVFWVNMPDFSSSLENIQVQRGLGTSTNGAGAFGATINLQTLAKNEEPYGIIDNSFGSFNTWKHTVQAGTGLMGGKFAIDARLSKISSDGFVDRATSDLKSYYLSAGYYGKNNLLKAVIFSGKERTYQSWWGLPEASLDTNRTWNYYTYENEVDNYQQDHYQLHYSHEFRGNLVINTALHYTYGRGYFEQYRAEDDFSDYGLPNILIGSDTITSTDLVRRRWLDNDFYGVTFSTNYYPSNKLNATLGGAWNNYIGGHFGEIIWAEYASNHEKGYRYYDNFAVKSDFNIFGKVSYAFTPDLSVFGDLQYRSVTYFANGVDNDQRFLKEDTLFHFFNPKAGANYRINDQNSVYAFVGMGHREPTRNDFIDAPAGVQPKPEELRNLELGYRFQQPNFVASANIYYMDYTNQLVLTGELNDVGSPVRTNVGNSFRRGIELQVGWQPLARLRLDANATLSQNKIVDFTEVIYVYDANWNTLVEEIHYDETDIAFSPSIIASGKITYSPYKDFEISWLTKYVGDQYLDNTSSDQRKLDAYIINDLRFHYDIKNWIGREIGVDVAINNIFNMEYESNGYTYGWINEDVNQNREREFYNYYYPQAGIHFLVALAMKF